MSTGIDMVAARAASSYTRRRAGSRTIAPPTSMFALFGSSTRTERTTTTDGPKKTESPTPSAMRAPFTLTRFWSAVCSLAAPGVSARAGETNVPFALPRSSTSSGGPA
jgi:hypothetical protein